MLSELRIRSISVTHRCTQLPLRVPKGVAVEGESLGDGGGVVTGCAGYAGEVEASSSARAVDEFVPLAASCAIVGRVVKLNASKHLRAGVGDHEVERLSVDLIVPALAGTVVETARDLKNSSHRHLDEDPSRPVPDLVHGLLESREESQLGIGEEGAPGLVGRGGRLQLRVTERDLRRRASARGALSRLEHFDDGVKSGDEQCDREEGEQQLHWGSPFAGQHNVRLAICRACWAAWEPGRELRSPASASAPSGPKPGQTPG